MKPVLAISGIFKVSVAGCTARNVEAGRAQNWIRLI